MALLDSAPHCNELAQINYEDLEDFMIDWANLAQGGGTPDADALMADSNAFALPSSRMDEQRVEPDRRAPAPHDAGDALLAAHAGAHKLQLQQQQAQLLQDALGSEAATELAGLLDWESLGKDEALQETLTQTASRVRQLRAHEMAARAMRGEGETARPLRHRDLPLDDDDDDDKPRAGAPAAPGGARALGGCAGGCAGIAAGAAGGCSEAAQVQWMHSYRADSFNSAATPAGGGSPEPLDAHALLPALRYLPSYDGQPQPYEHLDPYSASVGTWPRLSRAQTSAPALGHAEHAAPLRRMPSLNELSNCFEHAATFSRMSGARRYDADGRDNDGGGGDDDDDDDDGESFTSAPKRRMVQSLGAAGGARARARAPAWDVRVGCAAHGAACMPAAGRGARPALTSMHFVDPSTEAAGGGGGGHDLLAAGHAARAMAAPRGALLSGAEFLRAHFAPAHFAPAQFAPAQFDGAVAGGACAPCAGGTRGSPLHWPAHTTMDDSRLESVSFPLGDGAPSATFAPDRRALVLAGGTLPRSAVKRPHQAAASAAAAALATDARDNLSDELSDRWLGLDVAYGGADADGGTTGARGAGAGHSASEGRAPVAPAEKNLWGAAEDAIIAEGVAKLGFRWRKIAASLPGRSHDAVRNRWHRLQHSARPKLPPGAVYAFAPYAAAPAHDEVATLAALYARASENLPGGAPGPIPPFSACDALGSHWQQPQQQQQQLQQPLARLQPQHEDARAGLSARECAHGGRAADSALDADVLLPAHEHAAAGAAHLSWPHVSDAFDTFDAPAAALARCSPGAAMVDRHAQPLPPSVSSAPQPAPSVPTDSAHNGERLAPHALELPFSRATPPQPVAGSAPQPRASTSLPSLPQTPSASPFAPSLVTVTVHAAPMHDTHAAAAAAELVGGCERSTLGLGALGHGARVGRPTTGASAAQGVAPASRPCAHTGSSSSAPGTKPNAYKCGKCGQPKRNHLCQMDGSSPASAARRLQLTQQAAAGAATATATTADEGAASAAGGLGAAASGPLLKPVWTRAEDQLIMAGVRQVGPRWNVIAQSMPGRSSHAVRNRWHRLQRFYSEHNLRVAQPAAAVAFDATQPPSDDGAQPIAQGASAGAQLGGASASDGAPPNALGWGARTASASEASPLAHDGCADAPMFDDESLRALGIGATGLSMSELFAHTPGR